MNYYLYKLAFDTAVHFGSSSSAQSLSVSEDHFCADTLFSALCHTALRLRGQEGIEQLRQAAENGQLLLSDSMPWSGDTYYLPKPFASARADSDIPASKRKAIKSLNWIPVEEYPAFIDSIRGGRVYDVEHAKTDFGVTTSTTKVRITQGEDSLPYQVGLFHFQENTGLWFLAGFESDDLSDFFQVLIEGLSLNGIGGKTSAGYGKFHVDDMILLNEPFDDVTEWLFDSLTNTAAARQVLLTTSLPSEEELSALLPDAEYMLTRRAGFIQSSSYAEENRRKTTQLFFMAGSVLPKRFKAILYEVGEPGKHPVYRLSAPLFLGVEL